MLKLHFKDRRQPPLWVVDTLYAIGSAPGSQLLLEGDHIDAVHAHLVREDNRFILKDNNSRSGCFINGQRISEREILPGDILRLGDTEIIVLDPRNLPDPSKEQPSLPWRLVSEGNWLGGKQFLVHANAPMVIGRGNQADIVIPGSHLSRRHTQIQVEGNHLRIRDLGSANGTFLNDLQIEDSTANNGDRLRLDVYSFRLVAPDSDWYKPRLRAPINPTKPVERKQPSNQPRRWKTRPTSPGNRVEAPSPQRRQHRHLALAAALALLATLAIAAILLS